MAVLCNGPAVTPDRRAGSLACHEKLRGQGRGAQPLATHLPDPLARQQAAQGFVIHLQTFCLQLFRRQRLAEIAIPLRIARQHLATQFRGLAPRPGLAPTPMHQPSLAGALETRPDPLGLPIAHAQQSACGRNTYEDENLPMIIEDMVSIPGCEGGALQSQHSLAIFGLGFNGWASLSVLERLEADDVFAFIASPGASPDYPARVRALNYDFLEEPRVKQHVLELPLRNVETCYRFLSELVTPHRFKDSVTLVPMGPKPHILASILVSMRFPEVSCMRVSAKRARPEKVEPNGEVVAVRVVVRKEPVRK